MFARREHRIVSAAQDDSEGDSGDVHAGIGVRLYGTASSEGTKLKEKCASGQAALSTRSLEANSDDEGPDGFWDSDEDIDGLQTFSGAWQAMLSLL